MDDVQTTTGPATVSYQDDDLVYVDPDTRSVVGRVEWTDAGKPKSLERPSIELEDDDDEAKPASKETFKRRGPRKRRIRYYPWGTYRSMKRLYKIEGKVPEERGDATLDAVLPKALSEPFWD